MSYYLIGERELVTGFALVGIKGTVADSREEALTAFKNITGQGNELAGNVPISEGKTKVLIITEQVAEFLNDEIRDWQMKGKYPLIVEIPCLQGSMVGKTTLTDSIREAIGIHI